MGFDSFESFFSQGNVGKEDVLAEVPVEDFIAGKSFTSLIDNAHTNKDHIRAFVTPYWHLLQAFLALRKAGEIDMSQCATTLKGTLLQMDGISPTFVPENSRTISLARKLEIFAQLEESRKKMFSAMEADYATLGQPQRDFTRIMRMTMRKLIHWVYELPDEQQTFSTFHATVNSLVDSGTELDNIRRLSRAI